jgi:FAD/FMN-containing dehydrogenase
VLGKATAEGWRVRLEGAGTWCPPDAPADLALTTHALAAVERIAPGDLVLTAQAGVPMTALARTLASHATRLAIDPPGDPARTLGSVLATATAGPNRQSDGLVRDQVLGVTLVTGDGRVVRAGGSVVKNVAGFDLAKLAVGGFGAFGLIAAAHLRLRAAPTSSVTLLGRGGFDPLYDAALAIAGDGGELGVLELLSPAMSGIADWTLLAEVSGADPITRAGAERIRHVGGSIGWATLDRDRIDGVRRALGLGAVEGPATLRFGVLPDGIPGLVELLGGSVGIGRFTAGAGRGGARWTGEAAPDQIDDLRRRLAVREIPVTVERAPWALRHQAGHFGAYREGVGRLSDRLRSAFDPRHTLVVPLEGERP